MNAVTFPVLADPATRRSEAREKALGLRELRYFLSVAQTGNIGRAARDLNISQPAISLQLRKLDERIRHSASAATWPWRDIDAGGRQPARPAAYRHAVACFAAGRRVGRAGAEYQIFFAVPAESSAPLMTPLALAFRSRWPDVTLDIREGSGADLEEWLLHRHVDLAVLQDPPSLPDIESTPILTESLGLVAPVHSHLLDDTRPISLREACGRCAHSAGSTALDPAPTRNAAQQSNVRLNPVLQVNSTTLAKVMVRSGLGCAILPRSVVQEEIARGALALRPIGQPPLTCTHVIAFHRAASNTLVAAFADMACDAMATLAENGVWPDVQMIRPTRGRTTEEAAIR